MMALRSVISCKIPMVIILGATGTGKTKLGVELGQRFGTEVISADSMQIYKGLDIVTAKASVQERELVPHHLVDILEPNQWFTVVDFRNRALKIIDNLIEQGKIPIIVGGTNYYIESIVYNILVENMDDPHSLLWEKSRRKRERDDYHKIDEHEPKRPNNTDEPSDATTSKDKVEIGLELADINKEQLKEDVNNEIKFTNEEIHAKLKAIDPVMASRLHPNNRRKILRSIEHWLKTGRRFSEVLDEQKAREGQLRTPERTVILWLKCDREVHDARLDARVDAMLRDGLIDELLDFHDRHNKQRIRDGQLPDYTKGIFQSLGFKEFHEYLILPEDQRTSDSGRALLELCIDNMKIATRRYARRQNKMVKGRFLEHHQREVPPIFELDTTNISKWDENVKNKAIEIIESFVKSVPCPYDTVKSAKIEDRIIDSHSNNFCDVCERLIIGDKEFADHLASHRHMKVLKKKKRLALKQKQEEETKKSD